MKNFTSNKINLLKCISIIACLLFVSQLQAQCPYSNTFYADLTPTGAGNIQNTTCAWGGEYYSTSVVLGQTYIFSTCDTSTFLGVDTQLTLYDASGTTVIDYDDDTCAILSTITWTATFNGIVHVLVNEYNCISGTSCIDLSVTWVGPEINIEGNNTSIPNGDVTPTLGDDTSFGLVAIGATATNTFTIQNEGAGDLFLSGVPNFVSISGDPGFTLVSQPTGIISPASSTTFQVLFSANCGDQVSQNATVSISSNDTDKSPYTFTVEANITGVDTDSDGAFDLCDNDDDNDGVNDASDPDDTDFNICGDSDADGCDDCSVTNDGFGALSDSDPSNDGADSDCDGICDATDPTDDASAVRGNMLTFDGADDYVSLGDNGELNFGKTDDFTLEAWINTASASSAMQIISKYDNDFSSGIGWGFQVSGTSLAFYMTGGGLLDLMVSVPSGLPNVKDGLWHHVAVSFDGSNSVTGCTFYVDGIAYAGIDGGGPVTNVTGTVTNTESAAIGAYKGASSGPGEFWNGSMDEIRVWDDIRSQTEIRENLHLSLSGGCDPSLDGYWKFNSDSDSATNALDYSGNGNDGVHFGSPLIECSQASVGNGLATSHNATATATNYSSASLHTDHNLGISFATTVPGGEIVVTYIDELPVNFAPAGAFLEFGNAHWIVDNYGPTNTSLDASLVFNYPDGEVTTTILALYKMHKRGSNEIGAWTETNSSAVASSTGAGFNFIEFDGISAFSMFIPSSNVSLLMSAVGVSAPDASFSYDAAAYCVDASDPTPTITGTAGGTFTALPSGLNINSSSGAIDVSDSAAATYTVTYTTTGTCPNSSGVSVTINALDNASFNYSAAAYCLGDSDPTPTITGLAGGSFSSLPVGLNINLTTGFINIGLSTPQAYTVTYTTAGTCPNISNVAVTIGTPPATPIVVSPITVCPGDDVILSATGSGTGSLIFYNNVPAPIGAVPMPPATGSLNIGALPNGSYTFGVTESNGACQSLPASIIVNVGDLNPPSAVSQNITAFLENNGTISITASDLDGGSSDNCGTVNFSASTTNFTCADSGSNTVTLTVSDGNGNSSITTASVTVVDTISPVAATQNITAYLDGVGTVSIIASDIDGGSSDNCGIQNLSASGTVFTCADEGPNNVTLTVTDINGNNNYNNATSVVTVRDTISPTAVTQNINVYLNGAGTVTFPASDLDGGSTDVCGIQNFSASNTTFTCAELGSNVVTLSVTDVNGNTNFNNATSFVTVIDTISPTAVAQNITAFLDISGNVSILASDLDGGSTDVCGIQNFSASNTTFTCADLGPNDVTLTVTDINGNNNYNNATSVVTVVAFGDATFNYANAAYCANASDPTPTITGTTGGTFTASPAGLIINGTSGEIDASASAANTYTITYTTTGTCPNSSDVSVTINASTTVTFTALADIALDAGVQTGISGGGMPIGGIYSGPGVTDNADGMTYDFDPAAAGAGTHTLTYTVTVSGCSDSATDTVEVFALESIAITEWISNPNGTTESTGEWIELYNYGAIPIDIQNWRVKDEDTNNSIITNTSFVVPAGGFVILVRNKTQIESKWFEGCAIDNVLQTSFGLANGSDEIIIENAAGNIVWSVAYKNDDTSGRATHYTEAPNFTNRFWGSKASTGVDRSGNDPATSTLGYEKHNVTANPLAVTSTTGDIGSPLNGTQTTIINQTVSVSPTSGACSVDAVVSIASSQIGVDYVLRDNLDDSTIEGPIAGTGSQIDFTSETLTASKTYNVFASATGTCSIEMSDTASVTLTATIDDASFTFPSAASQCDQDQTPNITGLAGGTFSSTSGLIINTLTGEVDNSASTAGAYTITYSLSGPCPNSSSVNFTVVPLFDASFTYDSSTYCLDTTDPTPTITGIAGGVFSSTPGLIITTSTGEIDVSNSTPGIYTVSYGGFCYNTENTSVTINAPDDASFNYSAAAYCQSDLDPTPTITGLAGGTFTSTAGLTINASTGIIDVSASTPGTYSVTYTTTGSCPNTSNVVVTVNSLDDASFNYSAAAYCQSDLDPTPTITGLAGGTFTNTAGLTLNVSTGAIDVSASTPGTYSVTYTSTGSCPNTSNVVVTVNSLDDASFAIADFCESSTNTISGIATPGGVFSIFNQTGSGLAIINNGTGILSNFVAGDQITIMYTTPSVGCANASTQVVNVTPSDDASFTSADFCESSTNTISGIATPGGVFSIFNQTGSGLAIINNGTGILSNFVAGDQITIEYTTPSGPCANTSTQVVNVLALNDASFNYSATSYCINDSNPTPSITGLAGGLFANTPAGLVINPTSGEIDVTTSANGVYSVTYTTSGSCPNSSSVSVVIDECAPDNDLCSSATPLSLGITLSGESTAGATDDSIGATDDTSCEPSTFKSDVWYTFQAPLTGLATVTTVISGSSTQANVAVYSSTNCSQLDVDLVGCSTGNGGETVNLTGLTPNATYYIRVWSDGVAVIRNAQFVEGTFNITVTETTLSTTDFDAIGFTYFPNPIGSTLTLKSEATISQIKVLNMLGQVVLRETPNATTKQLDLSNLQSGAYFVEVSMQSTNGNRTKTIRVLKE
ncbi:LamG-like jellyroll fold domain-containing protein [Lacinutrix jangbogonensis]|uniref:LamG-like jellyroll fold domain-containing protein n=1 Tax=Lacinutrix jangbogonensis TaxID=1469557 RepID=UPI00053E481C|nr:LamG-like jellyroll fold domain-containing protein [Lacinutrix jangbogonensis]